jgi:transcriptional regulator with XRE-family HTH domain
MGLARGISAYGRRWAAISQEEEKTMEPIESPITKLRKELNLSVQMMAVELIMTSSRYNHIEAGAMPELHATIIKLCEAHRGSGEGLKMASEYREWRKSLPPETNMYLQTRLWPGGPACGMCL